MKKIIIPLILALSAGISLLFLEGGNPIKVDESIKFAEPGMVAYAASYSTDPTNEPNYSTQNTKTFQYLNLGNTLGSYRGDSVKVGIIDSGINYDHEDFMVSGSTKVKGDSKYYAYQSSSWVYYKASQHGYSYIDDSLGHGTNVAATVAAAINSVGGTGLAPNVELYVYKVTNSSNGYEFGAIQNALMDAKTLGLDVINMSFQSYEHAVSYNGSTMGASSGCSTILSYYLNQAYDAGITLVGAAGNYNTDEPSYPGSNNHVINVGSLNQTATDKAGFSNYGSTIDLVAPGYVYVADESSNTAYTNTQGTSFSAPLVTAAIALYKQKNPSATPEQIESALYASCDPIDDSGSAYTNWAGNGALNVAKFLGINDDGPTDIVINNPEIVDEELELSVGQHLDLDYTVNGVGTFDDSVNFYTLSGEENVVSVSSSGRITAVGEGSDYVIIESNVDSNVYTQVYVTVTSSGGGGGDSGSQKIVANSSTTYYETGAIYPTGSTSSGSTECDAFSVSWLKNSGNNIVYTYSELRVYGSHSFMITPKDGYTITSVVITANNSSYASAVGGFSLTNCSKAVNNSTVTLTPTDGTKTLGFTNSAQSRLNYIVVNYESEDEPDLYDITVNTPCKASYNVGDYFDPTGLIIDRYYTNDTQDTYSYNGHELEFSFSPSLSTPLTEDDVDIIITYGGQSTSLSIIIKTLSYISISGYTTSFVEGDDFEFGGTVTAHYSDLTTIDVTNDASFSGYNMTVTGNHTVTVTYSGANQHYQINVGMGTLSSIAVSDMTTDYVKDSSFSFDGTCTATFANGYQKVVTPTSVTSPDMSTGGSKTITVSYTYNGNTRTTTYEINVNSYRTVMEASTLTGTITWPSSATPTISGDVTGLSVASSGKTVYENTSFRLGTGSGGGTLSISASKSIKSLTISAKYYSSTYSSSVLKVDGQSISPLTSGYNDYSVTLTSAKTSFTILTENSSSRVNIQSITIYANGPEVDIGQTEDCVGLESFINSYMHMDYVENLGYCKDNEHHYYVTAKAAFNALNTHQRSLFTTNSAYLTEWTRLSTWASFNGDSLNGSNILALSSKVSPINNIIDIDNSLAIIVIISIISLSTIGVYFYYKKKKEN